MRRSQAWMRTPCGRLPYKRRASSDRIDDEDVRASYAAACVAATSDARTAMREGGGMQLVRTETKSSVA